jgi:hypothetical protein
MPMQGVTRTGTIGGVAAEQRDNDDFSMLDQATLTP